MREALMGITQAQTTAIPSFHTLTQLLLVKYDF